MIATNHDSTPSTILADALKQAVADSCHEAEAVSHADGGGVQDLVQRVVVLDSSVNEALEEQVYTLRFGPNGHAAGLEFSDLAAALVEHYLEHFNGAGNGNGSNGNGTRP